MEELCATLSASGIDITHALDVRWYNAYIAEEKLPLKPLPTFGRKDGALAVLIGNSKALWPEFLKWLGEHDDPSAVAEPLDTFTTAAIKEAIATFKGHKRGEVYWTSESGSRLVSMQRVAVCSALCYHDSETQLAIHPTFGAWCAFRAVLVLDAAPSAHGVSAAAPPRLDCLLTDADKQAARAAMAEALEASDEANLCTQLHGAKGMERDVRLAWAALRDCVQLGAEHRYSEAQLVYHYTKDKAVLLQAMRS